MKKDEPGFIKIATIRTDLPEKFGIPRQSGMAPSLRGVITFEEGYRQPEAVRGLEGFDYIWLIWLFENREDTWHPTVRPPRLGGNAHMGVFATRSPFRPNPIGLSCVKLERVELSKDGPRLYVSGADLKDKTAILDIKPYLPFADARPDAAAGFAAQEISLLKVETPPELLSRIPQEKRQALLEILKNDPRPAYQEDPERIYGMSFSGYEVKFSVKDKVLKVVGISG